MLVRIRGFSLIEIHDVTGAENVYLLTHYIGEKKETTCRNLASAKRWNEDQLPRSVSLGLLNML